MKRSVSISVYHHSGKILAVTNRRFGGFTLPGGKVEPGEDMEVAAFRELYEETGLVPNALKYLGCSKFDNPLTNDAPFLVSHYEAILPYPQPRKMEDGTEPFWTDCHSLFRHENSIFAEHYRQIEELGVIQSRSGSAVMD